jgi:hypothetical protein
LLADVGEWEQEKWHGVESVCVYDRRVEEEQFRRYR